MHDFWLWKIKKESGTGKWYQDNLQISNKIATYNSNAGLYTELD